MDFNDAYYHGVLHQVKRVLTAMTDEQIDTGLTAFEDGSSDWGNCFFARAFNQGYRQGHHEPEAWLAKQMGFGTNKIPVRIVYSLFDGVGRQMFTKSMLYELISNIRDGRRPEEVLAIIKGIDYSKAEDPNYVFAGPTC